MYPSMFEFVSKMERNVEASPRLVERRIKVGVDSKGYDVYETQLIMEKGEPSVETVYLLRNVFTKECSTFTEEQARELLGVYFYEHTQRMV